MSFYHGISGLNAASKALDISGHNIANSGTIGFKKSRVDFSEMVVSASANSCCNVNGGMGVATAAVTQQFTQGVIKPTSNGLDMAINGDGFFVIGTPEGTAYTRNGAFQLDRDGYLVTVQGERVQGWQDASATGSQPADLLFPVAAGIEGKQTTSVKIGSGNLPATAPDATSVTPNTPRHTYGTSITVYDSQGVALPVEIYFVKNGSNTWDVYDGLDDPSATPPVTYTPIGQVVFDGEGLFDATASTSPLTLNVDPAVANPNNPPAPFTVDLELSGMTQSDRKWSVGKMTQDGFASGELMGVNVSKDGTLMASYSNGLTRPEGKVALARFTNPQGLAPSGNNNWVPTNDSGVVVYGSAGAGSFGQIQGAALEESNVDLTAELVEMMTAQRSYQANAQTIKTQDQVFSTLVNLR